MLAIGRKQTDLAPIYTDTILKMAIILKKCEESQDTWEASTIRGWVYFKPFPITAEENRILTDIGLTTVSQLFDLEEPRSLEKQAALVLPGNLHIKINNIVANIKRKRMEFRNAPLHRNHAESILQEKQINLSYLIKKGDKKMQKETWIAAPSRQTRIWDGISVPDIQTILPSKLQIKLL